MLFDGPTLTGNASFPTRRLMAWVSSIAIEERSRASTTITSDILTARVIDRSSYGTPSV